MKEIFLKSFNTITEAELAKNLLEQYEIKSIMKTKWGGILGNVDASIADLFVSENDFVKAKVILGEKTEE